MLKADLTRLWNWYLENRRPLPWRENRDPYRIWISETMLQQTTTTAVIPYFKRFLEKFPTLEDLADAPESEVLEAWAGLGYYSRARNLHKAAQALVAEGGFPEDHLSLLAFPGFGPYTSRAVSSLAFGEKVGVLDGNVIRVLCRYYGDACEWWKTKPRQKLQDLADQWVQPHPSEDMNQAMMELGATICTPQNPTCLLCPMRRGCQAHAQDLIGSLPMKRPKKAREHWQWQAVIHTQGEKIALVRNRYAPFLKGQWILPGTVQLQRQRPKTFDFRHSITHHDIFVTVCAADSRIELSSKDEVKWIHRRDLAKWVPASLVQKAIRHAEDSQ